ncbi:sugar-binding protein [Pseudomonas mangrovi]|uniref:Sugar-binding protein n=2 Tax=Pseudomonas mangrovi TaxID=2161748 RepID=A0A2T5PFN6_9PSED|nr:RHS repeat domain-containing protein [Pseudomonas mangrovi]PTU76511.1 sugar-binding protein [Pseudomonas mangrovi]
MVALFASSTISAQSRSWSYTYNTQGQVLSADGPRTDVQDVTTYTYDAQGNLTQVSNALGHTTLLSGHDDNGRPGQITDPNGVVSVLGYTPQGWLASISVAGAVTSFEHDAIGQITRITQPDGSALQYSWSDARRLESITNSLGERIEYQYDLMGNRTAQDIRSASGALAHQQRWVYDEMGRLLRTLGAAGQASQVQYDLNDNPVVTTNPKQHSHVASYDALDRIVASTDPLSGVTAFGYDAQDNLTQVSDPRGVTTRYEYDGLGNLTRLISPDSGTATYTHDAAGNLTSKTDARGVVTTYSYDALNRLTGRQYPATPALNVQYHYDMTADGNKGIGRLTAIQDASGVIGYHYDARGNLVEQIRSVEVGGTDRYDRLAYIYDNASRLTRIDYPAGFSIHYLRGTAGQVAEVKLQLGSGTLQNVASQIHYLPFGPLKSLNWANGISLSRSYDQDYRLTQQQAGTWQTSYGYDANSNIEQMQSSLLGNLSYSYDALDRLTAETQASRILGYSYDAVGNRTAKAVTTLVDGQVHSSNTVELGYAPDSNRLASIASQPVTTDAAGNLTQDRANRTFDYDAQGRLVRVRIGGAAVAEFRYNALGQRTHKVSSAGTTVFLYGPDGQLLGETLYNAQGLKTGSQFYVWLDAMPLAGMRMTFGSEGQVTGRTPFFLHSDHLNTPRMATNASQQLLWQWTSDAFGMGPASGSLAMNLRFPGQYYDAETGLHYNYFRDYDPETGRYVESDPIGLAGGINTYGYVGGNPLTYFDPNGLTQLSCTTLQGAVHCNEAVSKGVNPARMSVWCLLAGTCETNESTSQNEKRPKNCPPGTKDIDKAKSDYGWDNDTLHGIKNGAHGGMSNGKSWTGIAPDGTVGINEDGEWVEQGHWEDLL